MVLLQYIIIAPLFWQVGVVNFSRYYTDHQQPLRMDVSSSPSIFSVTTSHDILTSSDWVETTLVSEWQTDFNAIGPIHDLKTWWCEMHIHTGLKCDKLFVFIVVLLKDTGDQGQQDVRERTDMKVPQLELGTIIVHYKLSDTRYFKFCPLVFRWSNRNLEAGLHFCQEARRCWYC